MDGGGLWYVLLKMVGEDRKSCLLIWRDFWNRRKPWPSRAYMERCFSQNLLYMRVSRAMNQSEQAASRLTAGSTPLLVDAKAAAKLLGIGQRKLWALTKGNTIPSRRIGRLVRYCPAELARWVREGCPDADASTKVDDKADSALGVGASSREDVAGGCERWRA
jgi:predicted DNA-binding transcriptional regulator AlpA